MYKVTDVVRLTHGRIVEICLLRGDWPETWSDYDYLVSMESGWEWGALMGFCSKVDFVPTVGAKYYLIYKQEIIGFAKRPCEGCRI